MQTSSLRIDNDAEEHEYNRTTGDIEKLGIVGVSNSLPLAGDEQTQFAFTTTEPTRMDTGMEYIKLPLSSYVKVPEGKNELVKVDRIGAFSELHKTGFVPMANLQMVPATFVPKHVVLAADLVGNTVCLPHIEADIKKHMDNPYYDAGPNSRHLEPGDRLTIKDISYEFASVNLLGKDGSSIGYGKVRICHLLHATRELL